MISIDFSTTCIGITVKGFYFYSIMRKEPKLPFEEGFTLITVPKTEDYLIDAIEIAKTILYIAEKHDCKLAVIEGYSFDSKSGSFDVLFESTGITKAFLRNQGLPVIKYAPSTVKKQFTGYGRATKLDVFNTFLKNDIDSVFWKRCNEYKDDIIKYTRNGDFREIMKPFEDIIDSFALSVCHEKIGK